MSFFSLSTMLEFGGFVTFMLVFSWIVKLYYRWVRQLCEKRRLLVRELRCSQLEGRRLKRKLRHATRQHAEICRKKRELRNSILRQQIEISGSRGVNIADLHRQLAEALPCTTDLNTRHSALETRVEDPEPDIDIRGLNNADPIMEIPPSTSATTTPVQLFPPPPPPNRGLDGGHLQMIMNLSAVWSVVGFLIAFIVVRLNDCTVNVETTTRAFTAWWSSKLSNIPIHKTVGNAMPMIQVIGIPIVVIVALKFTYDLLNRRPATVIVVDKKKYGESKHFEVAFDPSNSCVATKMVDGNQLTVVWYPDDLQVSHIDRAVVDEFIADFQAELGKEKPISQHCGNLHDYVAAWCSTTPRLG